MTSEAPLFRRAPSWWDEFEVPPEHSGAHLLTWLDEHAPKPLEHDYVLYTDGSGCIKGWGASAAIFEEVGGDEGTRSVLSRDVRISATYGSTVNRRELEAMLDGVHAILTHRMLVLSTVPREEDYEKPIGGPLAALQGNERVTIMWHTDRRNLASSLLFGTDGSPLASRGMDRDLWLRYSTMARHVCITPVPAARNTIEYQRIADALCGLARLSLMGIQESIKAVTNGIIDDQLWNQPKNQQAMF